MEIVHSNGVALNCQRLGSGPRLIMCHGLVFGSIATWYFTAASCLASRFEVILYDQRGHGKSPLTPSGYDLDTLANDLDGLRAHFHSAGDDAPVALVGHSYGALVVLNYALRYPHRVSRLALIDAPLPASRYIYPSLANADNGDALAGLLPEGLRPQIEPGSRAARRLHERMDYLFRQSSLCRDVRNASDIDDAILRRLEIPVLCLYGRHSDCLAAGERLAAILPDARLRLLECGHYIPMEAAREMTHALDEFL